MGMSPTQDLSKLSEAELMRLEREVAARHLNKFPYFAVFWAFSNLAIWLALWPLVFFDVIPLWLGFIIASLNVTLSYLPSHEAQHDIIAKPGTKLRWLNQLVGHVSTIPLVLPYRVAKSRIWITTSTPTILSSIQITPLTLMDRFVRSGNQSRTASHAPKAASMPMATC
jgi:hypothetical protein